MPRCRKLLALAVLAAIPACDGANDDATREKMRDIQKRIEASLPRTQEVALEQPADADTVRRVQENLRALHEYLDEPDGDLDSVTVNAIQAFQRSVGLEADGLLTPETLSRLEKAAAEATPTRGEDGASSGAGS